MKIEFADLSLSVLTDGEAGNEPGDFTHKFIVKVKVPSKLYRDILVTWGGPVKTDSELR